MKIGIISDPDHAKSHVKALRDRGHEVLVLGGSPTSVPPTVEVLVCRIASCGHDASQMAQNLNRSGTLPVIFENGVTTMLEALDALNQDSTPSVLQPEVTIADQVGNAVEVCNLISPKLVRLGPQQAVDYLTHLGLIKGQKQRAKALTVLQHLSKRDFYSVRRVMLRSSPPQSATRNGCIFNIYALSYKSKKNKRSAAEPLFVRPHVPRNVVDAYVDKFDLRGLPEIEEPEIEEPEIEEPEIEEPEIETEPEPEPEPEPELVQEEVEEEVEESIPLPPPPPSRDLMEDIMAALGLLHENMEKSGYRSITVTSDGSVSFERIVVEKGEFKL